MSNDEDDKDMELKDLIVQTLEANGLLAKMKAQIRSSVFMALDEAERGNQQLKSVDNPIVKQLLLLEKGIAAASLVRDFLETCNLDFTLAVFDPEINDASTMTRRDDLAAMFKLDASTDGPILLELLNNLQQLQRDEKNQHNNNNKVAPSTGGNLSNAKIDEIRIKFERLDTKRTGMLDRASIGQLLADIFPHFNNKTLSRIVEDEFAGGDESESSSILWSGVDFKRFIAWCKRWYASCYATSVQFDDSLLLTNGNTTNTSTQQQHNQQLPKIPTSANEYTDFKSASNSSHVFGKKNDFIEDQKNATAVKSFVDKDDISGASVSSNKSNRETFPTGGGGGKPSVKESANKQPTVSSSSSASQASNGKPAIGGGAGALHNSNSASNKNLQEDNYDEDFTASGGATPRTSRADNSIGGSKKQLVASKSRGGIVSDEDIDENISYVEESSKSDETTQDKSISTINGNNDADFLDDVSI